jgi:hypothetical protein
VPDEGEDCDHPHIEPARKMTAADFTDAFMAANDPSSATAATERVDCNLDARAGFAAALG